MPSLLRQEVQGLILLRKSPSFSLKSTPFILNCLAVCLCVRVSVCLCVCLSVTQHLTSPMFFRLTNDTTYLTANEGQNICAVFSENAPLQRWSACTIVRLMRSRPFLSLRKMRMRFIMLIRLGPLSLCIVKAQEVTTKGAYRLPHAICYCS